MGWVRGVGCSRSGGGLRVSVWVGRWLRLLGISSGLVSWLLLSVSWVGRWGWGSTGWNGGLVRIREPGKLEHLSQSNHAICAHLSVAVAWVLGVSDYATCGLRWLSEASVAVAVGSPDWRRWGRRARWEGRGWLGRLLVIVSCTILSSRSSRSVAWVGSLHLLSRKQREGRVSSHPISPFDNPNSALTLAKSASELDTGTIDRTLIRDEAVGQASGRSEIKAQGPASDRAKCAGPGSLLRLGRGRGELEGRRDVGWSGRRCEPKGRHPVPQVPPIRPLHHQSNPDLQQNQPSITSDSSLTSTTRHRRPLPSSTQPVHLVWLPRLKTQRHWRDPTLS